MNTNFSSIVLEITSKCKNCGDTIAVNSAVNKIWCSACQGETTFSEELWSMLLGEIISISNEMSHGEARNTSVEDAKAGTVRVSFKKTDLICHHCKQQLAFDETENDSIICKKCEKVIPKRMVPKPLIKKGFNFFIDEDNYQIEEEKDKSYIKHPVEISCTNCGAPIKADGTERLVTCNFCNTGMMIQDEVWYRLHPSINVRPWYFIYRADMDKKIQSLNFDSISGICCDEEQMLYCVGENADGAKALWAMSPQCELKWMNLIRRDKRWPEYFSKIELLADGNLLIWNEEVHWALVYDRHDGTFIRELGGIEPANAKVHMLDFFDCVSAAADPDGSIVCLINTRILRFSAEGEGIYLWPKSFMDFQRLQSIYKKSENAPEKRNVYDIRGGGFILPQKLKSKASYYSYIGDTSVHISKDSSLFILAPFHANERREILGGAVLTKFDRQGKIVYRADLKAYGADRFQARTDDEGYAYVIMQDAREEFENSGKVIRVSPDGTEVKVIANLPFSAVISSDSCFTVGGDGTIYSIGNDEEIRIFNRDGKYLWRNEAALKSEKRKIEEEED